ncbi:MAG: low molecular weight protein-tyrosine-phosphatase [Gammaproteobacteria bacterium]
MKDNKCNGATNVNVLFVCMGNICRSPTAHGVFQSLIDLDGLSQFITVDSAGTYDFHIGKKPDARSIAAAAKRNFDLTNLRARQIVASDFKKFDLILAMDNENYLDLQSQSNNEDKGKIKLFLEFSSLPMNSEVPDPYYSGEDGFETVLDLVEDASRGLLAHIKVTHLSNL